jgi:hypothetical protein
MVILLFNYFNHFRAPHITSKAYDSLIICGQFLSRSMPFFNRLEDRNLALLSMGSQPRSWDIHEFHWTDFSYTIEIKK